VHVQFLRNPYTLAALAQAIASALGQAAR